MQCTNCEWLFEAACLWSGGIIGPYFIENEDAPLFVPALHAVAVDDVWVQQNDAICHTSHATTDLLWQTIDDLLIRRNSNVN